MHRNRSLPGLIVTALTVGLVAVGFAAPAQAAPEPKIWGVVVDGNGDPILGAEVRATGDGRASDLSYEGGPDARAGYFELFVGELGEYTVSVAKKGYESERIGGIELTRRSRVVGLGEIELMRSTSVAGKVTSTPVRVGDRPKVKVVVDYTGKGAPTGAVKVHIGKKVLGTARLKESNKGSVTVTLDKQTKTGTYKLTASYGGDTLFTEAESKSFSMTVSKAPKKRPAHYRALAYLG